MAKWLSESGGKNGAFSAAGNVKKRLFAQPERDGVGAKPELFGAPISSELPIESTSWKTARLGSCLKACKHFFWR